MRSERRGDHLGARRSGRDELSQMLRQLGIDASLSGIEAGKATGFSQPTISRWERGLFVPRPDEVATLARIYHAPAAVGRRLVQMAEDLREEFTSARVVMHRGAGSAQQRIGRIEAASESIATFHPAMIPGLLQTEAYARAVFGSGLTGAELEKAVTARLDRQRLLTQPGRRFVQVLTEGALRWHAHSPGVMAEQLDHLAEVAELPAVRLGVIPWTVPARVFPMHGFDLYDRRAVIVSTMTATALLTDQLDLTRYVELIGELEVLAAFGDEARELIRRLADDYRALRASGVHS
ncbi:MAG: helix-turn-helix domain-containing protein [Chloroflexi bacterium]|nr:helix-turn-helix domain-containing protein [Chloroflexota bacterium]